MAQALISIHNITPQSSVDEINREYTKRSVDDDDPDLTGIVEDLYSNLLVDIWHILNQFEPGVLEQVVTVEQVMK
jgi:hypothetical protein